MTPQLSAERLVSLRRVQHVVPSPDGTWLAVALARLDHEGVRYVTELWRVSLADGAATRLTRGASNDRSPAFRRDGALGFLSNRVPREGKAEEGDDERAQVWVLPAHGGEAEPLTDEPLGVNAFAFAADADRLVALADALPGVPFEAQRSRAAELAKKGPSVLRYTSTPVRHWDHWLSRAAPHVVAFDERGGARVDLTPDADAEFRDESEWALSPDGRHVAITVQRLSDDRIVEFGLVLIDPATGARRTLVDEARVSVRNPCFSRDGRSLACVLERRAPGRHGRPALWLFDVASGVGRELAAGWDRWPVPACFTVDGRELIVTVDDEGTVPVFAIDVASGAWRRITHAAAGGSHDHLSALPSGGALVGLRHRITHPPEVFRSSLDTGSAPALLTALSGYTEADGDALATVAPQWLVADDGVALQGYAVAPRDATVPAPALLWIHGGPVSQWADAWHWRWNPLVAASAGYVVALPNPRGSTGRGQAFVEGIWNNTWGDQCYRDVMTAADALARHPAVDGGRMAAMGGSFGGYMSNWIGVSTERFRCLVTHASIYAMSPFSGTTDHPAWWYQMMGVSPYEDAAAHERWSPHGGVSRWKTPTLVLHGERDYRVPISEALMLFEALQHHRIPSELVVFPDEGHWIAKPRNAVAWYGAVMDFLGRHLAPVAP